METSKIKEFVDAGLITPRVLIEASGVKKSAISNRLNLGWKFKPQDIDALRVMYWPLFQELYPEFIIVNLNRTGESHVTQERAD